jgi:hypothetical protein
MKTNAEALAELNNRRTNARDELLGIIRSNNPDLELFQSKLREYGLFEDVEFELKTRIANGEP